MEDVVPYRLCKRIADKAAAVLLIVLLSPVLLFALIVLGLDMLLQRADRGGWLYRERRISQGRRFDLLKFRVLREDALVHLRSSQGAYSRLYEREEDNLTRAGRILKRMYLDELPQLFNVLRGDISLVGPRPWPISMVEKQIDEGFDYRNRIVAGWTGPAQVRKDSPKRSQATAYDLQYLEACQTLSAPRLLRYDASLLAQSVATMLRGKGLKY